jgi:nucleoside-diphosphate-sugar epimerase
VAETDVIFHLAAEPGVRPSWGERFEQYVRNNVVATQHVLEAAHDCGGRRLVYASSSSVYGQAQSFPTSEDAVPAPFSPYGVTKLAGEHLAMLYAGNHGLDCVALRYFSVYGPRQRPDMAFRRFCAAALDGHPLEVYGDGGQTRDFTYVGDVVDATRAAAEAPGVAGQVINVGGGSRVRLDEAIDVIGELAGRPLEVRRTEGQKGDVRDTGAAIARACALLGFEPRVDLADGLAAQWEWARVDAGREALAQ